VHTALRRILLLAALAVAVPAFAQTADSLPRDSVKIALIRQILAETHAGDQAMVAIETSLPMQRAANPRIPAVFWDRMLTETRAHRGDLETAVVAVYDRHFTADELRGLLAFYRTPTGRKLLQEQPAIIRESMEAGQQWGMEIGRRIGAQLDAEGVRAAP
jgi:uncharacterized protein